MFCHISLSVKNTPRFVIFSFCRHRTISGGQNGKPKKKGAAI